MKILKKTRRVNQISNNYVIAQFEIGNSGREV